MEMAPRLTIRTVVSFLVGASVMALINIYMVLLTAWADNGAIVAVFICLLLLGKNQRNIIILNLGQTAISAGGATGFTVSICATYYILDPTWQPPLFKFSLLVMAMTMLGVALAVPLRRAIIDWFWPTGVACAVVLKAVTSDDPSERRRALAIMGITGGVTSVFSFLGKVATTKGGPAILGKISLPWAGFGKGLAISVDPMMYGLGLLIGPRIATSMLIGALLVPFAIMPLFEKYEIAGSHLLWISIGLLTFPAISSIIFKLKFMESQKLTGKFSPRGWRQEDRLTPKELILMGVQTLVAFLIASAIIKSVFGVAIGSLIIAAIISIPLCIMLARVCSVTDINVVRLMGMVLVVVFAIFTGYGEFGILTIGVFGAAIASVGVDLCYGFRTGNLVNAPPKPQIKWQFLGIIPAAFAGVYFLHLLHEHFGFGKDEFFPAPGAQAWAGMVRGVSGSVEPEIWMTFGIVSVIGVGISFFEAWPRTSRFTPSPFAMGIALLVGFEMSSAICLGGVIRLVWNYIGQRRGTEDQANNDAFQTGTAAFAAAAFMGIIAMILIAVGFFHLPPH